MIIGRNGSGKSNALDALSPLALLASDRTLADLDRDDPEVAGLRGGLRGCAPFGHGTVEVGVDVELVDGTTAALDIEFDTERSEVVHEKLVRRKPRGDTILIDAAREEDESGLITAKAYSGGSPRAFQMPANRMVTFQATSRIPEDTKARKQVVSVANQVIGTLSGIFVLDLIPSNMRQYVRIGSPADRTGSSLSSQLHELREDPDTWGRLLELVQELVGSRATELTFAEGRYPGEHSPADVMVALKEKGPDGEFLIPASTMSDGTLRYLAVLAALLTITRITRKSTAATPDIVSRTVVIEEIENGLFPDQAAHILSLLREEAGKREMTLVTTTHSPALLDAVTPEDHEGIVSVQRDERARSRLIPLLEHDNYLELVESGRLGQAVASGELYAIRTAPDFVPLEELLA